MNVLKALNNNRYVDSVDILVKFMEIENPCRIIIHTDYVKGLFGRNIKPNSIPLIRFNIMNSEGEAVYINGIKSISSSTNIEHSNLLNYMRGCYNNSSYNSETKHRRIELDLIKPMDIEDMQKIIQMFNAKVDIEHYSFRQTYNY